MPDPQTVNTGLFVPNTGADIDTWGSNALNPDFVVIDAMIAGVQTIGVTNAPVTLTSPAGFTATPSPGPTQSQNRVLRFTGTLTGNVRVTLPLPGAYLIDNRTLGNFVLSFQGVTATEVVGIQQGAIVEIYNDGANVRFVNLGRVGAIEHWAGINVIPAWVTACTVKPFLYDDGTIYNFADFPYLAAVYLGQFGGNGITTFGVPDLRGRVPIAYDGGTVRITTAGCGIDGLTVGSSGGTQFVDIRQTDLPNVTVGLTGSVNSNSGAINYITANTLINAAFAAGTGGAVKYVDAGGAAAPVSVSGSLSTGSTASLNGGVAQTDVRNVQPGQVTGIWVTKT